MLTELRIKDFAIIDSLSLSLAEGFNVLSGETGAGKSIIVGALGLLLGERASSDQVRAGSDKAVVEGTFDASSARALQQSLRDQGISIEDDFITLRREILASGRGRAWINGFAVNNSVLSAAGRQLASIHGQHEAQSLLDADSQRDVLDEYAMARDHAAAVAELHARLSQIEKAVTAVAARRSNSGKRIDYLRHMVAELRAVKLVEGEEERLDEEASRLEHAVELTALATEGLESLNDDDRGVLDALKRIRRNLDSLARIDSGARKLSESLDSAEVVLAELSRDLNEYADRIEVDPERLMRVNERRSVLFQIARKHGGSIREALLALDAAEKELGLLESSSDDLAALEAERLTVLRARDAAAEQLTAKRTAGALKLEKKVSAMLPSLGMPGGRVRIVVSPLGETGSTGADAVNFLVQLNVGHDPRELAKTASGGELSRIMLAIKSILANLDKVPSLVFDEVDAGIGGEVALQVGDALRALAKHHQVLVITHLPQIAARAHRHLIVRKLERRGIATADVEIVEGGARVAEITRMLSGDSSSKTGREHALELLESASEQKR